MPHDLMRATASCRMPSSGPRLHAACPHQGHGFMPHNLIRATASCRHQGHGFTRVSPSATQRGLGLQVLLHDARFGQWPTAVTVFLGKSVNRFQAMCIQANASCHPEGLIPSFICCCCS